jgi:hypothetical protein
MAARRIGFLSYARVDDTSKLVSKLHEYLERNCGMHLGYPTSIYVDKRDIQPGTDWAVEIESSLSKVEALFPVMSPSFFNSPNCRREVEIYAAARLKAGKRLNIFPILLVPVPQLKATSNDPLVQQLVSCQFADLTSVLRKGFRDPAKVALDRVAQSVSVQIREELHANNAIGKVLQRALESASERSEFERELSRVKLALPDSVSKDTLLGLVELGESEQTVRPGVAMQLFTTIEAHLKLTGDMPLVERAAKVVIDAIKQVTRSEATIRIEIHAHLCGLAWAKQRMGKNGQAELIVQEQLAKCIEIGDVELEAQSHKMLGRGDRILAQDCKDTHERTELLVRSEQRLLKAASCYSHLEQTEHFLHEAADCYSLLARTLLVARRLREAEEYANSAFAHIRKNTKEYLDLLIVKGEILATRGDGNAHLWFNQAIQSARVDGAEKNEIKARAHFQLAELFLIRRLTGPATEQFLEAKRIWQSLNDTKMTALCDWRMIFPQLRSFGINDEAIRILSQESPVVSLRAVEVFKSDVASKMDTRASHRAAVPTRYWEDLISRVRKHILITAGDQ